MGIVKRNLELEEYFDAGRLTFNLLSDAEYRSVIKRWMNSFEESLVNDSCERGANAVSAVEELLPLNSYIFTCPNYPYIDNCTNQPELVTYGYLVENFREIDRDVLCNNGAIVCDIELGFMCAFIFEGVNSYPEIFVEKNA